MYDQAEARTVSGRAIEARDRAEDNTGGQLRRLPEAISELEKKLHIVHERVFGATPQSSEKVGPGGNVPYSDSLAGVASRVHQQVASCHNLADDLIRALQ